MQTSRGAGYMCGNVLGKQLKVEGINTVAQFSLQRMEILIENAILAIYTENPFQELQIKIQLQRNVLALLGALRSGQLLVVRQ